MMKRLFILLVTLMLLTGCAARPSTGTYRQITAQEAAELMESETGYYGFPLQSLPPNSQPCE